MNRTLKRDITEEEMRAYEEDGVVLIRGVLDEEWVERMRAALERFYADPTPWGQNVNPEGTPGASRSIFICGRAIPISAHWRSNHHCRRSWRR